jgi:hypothetical protein
MPNEEAKIPVIWLALIVLGIVVFWQLGVFDQFAGMWTKGAANQPGGGNELPPTSDQYVSVTRPLKFALTDKYAGSGVASATIMIYDGDTKLESVTTDSDGTKASGQSYTSGKQLRIYVNKSNSKAWYSITVPKMLSADVDAMTSNPVKLDFFTLDTSVTLKVAQSNGTSYSTGGSYNWTQSGVTTETLTVTGYISADGKGFISSHDPINDIDWNVVLYGKLYNTNYELLTLTGWDRSYERGSALWGSAKIPDTGVTKYKVGETYVYSGTFGKTLTLKKGSYTGDAADLVLYLYAYSDGSYHKDYGSFGPDAVAMASAFTLNLVD